MARENHSDHRKFLKFLILLTFEAIQNIRKSGKSIFHLIIIMKQFP